MEIIIILFLILLNGVFAMSEMALISARKTALMKEAKEGNRKAKVALSISEEPEKFLSTIQISITLIGILTGIYSGNTIIKQFSAMLISIKIPPAYSFAIAQTIVVIAVTYLTLILGELVPKRIGLASAENVAKLIAIPMHYISIIASPFVFILSKSTTLFIKILGIKNSKNSVTEEEIKSMVEEGMRGGEVKEMEQDIVERVFFLGNSKIDAIMTHRNDIVWLDSKMTNEEINNFIKKNTFEMYPVAESKLDNIIGVIYLKDLFGKLENDKFKIEKNVKRVQYFHDNMDVYEALEDMKKNHVEYGLVCDEFGSIKGIVTLKNILEALVGSIKNEIKNKSIVKRKNGGYFVDGQCHFYDFLQYFNIEDEKQKYDYNTISGLILDELKHVPLEGESIIWNSFSFEIVDMDGARIDKVLVNKIDDKTKK